MKKLYLIAGILILIAIASVYLLFPSSKNKDIYKPIPVVQFQPSSSIPRSSTSTDNLSSEDKTKLQLKADRKLATEREILLQKYPWFLNLPFQKAGYFVYFDSLSETFIAKLYPQKTSSIPLDEQINSLKKTVTGQINALGSDTGKYKIDWKVIPE